MHQGFEFRVSGLGSRVSALGGFGAYGVRFKFQGLRFRI